MNAVSSSTSDFIEENGGDTDSENSEGFPEYYQPISTETGDEEINGEFVEQHSSSDDDADRLDFNRLPNGNAHCVENGMSSLDLRDEEGGSSSEKEEEDRMREVRRAFVEDERRRQAPLTAENATRVMEAMRGVSFGGIAPDWANQVPENQWIDQLRRLRQPSTAAGASSAVHD